MSAGDLAYLVLVIAGFTTFILVLGYHSCRTLLESRHTRREHAPSRAAPSGMNLAR
jgi:hypothetical protein